MATAELTPQEPSWRPNPSAGVGNSRTRSYHIEVSSTGPTLDAVRSTGTAVVDPVPDADLPACLNAREVAKLLRLDRQTIYEMVKRGALPCRRVGRRILFSRDAVLEWLGNAQ